MNKMNTNLYTFSLFIIIHPTTYASLLLPHVSSLKHKHILVQVVSCCVHCKTDKELYFKSSR